MRFASLPSCQPSRVHSIAPIGSDCESSGFALDGSNPAFPPTSRSIGYVGRSIGNASRKASNFALALHLFGLCSSPLEEQSFRYPKTRNSIRLVPGSATEKALRQESSGIYEPVESTTGGSFVFATVTPGGGCAPIFQEGARRLGHYGAIGVFTSAQQ